MSLELPGAATSISKVTDITALGFWLWVDDQEYFVPFDDYPVFRNATVAQIYAVERLCPTNSIGRNWTRTSNWKPWRILNAIP